MMSHQSSKPHGVSAPWVCDVAVFGEFALLSLGRDARRALLAGGENANSYRSGRWTAAVSPIVLAHWCVHPESHTLMHVGEFSRLRLGVEAVVGSGCGSAALMVGTGAHLAESR